MKKSILIPFYLIALMWSCGGDTEDPCPDNNPDCDSTTTMTESDSIVLSFAFVGCNRIDRHDTAKTYITDSSSANLAVLERIMRDVMREERQPDLFFFLGDIVLAETNLLRLNYELKHWVKLYNDTAKTGPMSASPNIEMVAIPGNHEMLTYHDYSSDSTYWYDDEHSEWPLRGATEVWMKYMHPFMPTDRDYITGADSVYNQMTFSFVRKNVAFIMMNTDTYNDSSALYPRGREGMIPYNWIKSKASEYHNDPAIDHIFVMGHKPAYTSSGPGDPLHFDTLHAGFMHSEELWNDLMNDTVLAMLSAHAHTYSRNQPMGHGTYQVIAGNGGSKDPAFYGYTIVNILANGEVELVSRGFENDGPHYYDPTSAGNGNRTVDMDGTTLIWGHNDSTFTATYK